MKPAEMNELIGRIWDTWGAMTPRSKRKVRRANARLADILDDMTRGVRQDLSQAWKEMNK